MLPINFMAVVLAGIAAFIIGFLMHGPIGGKLWMKLANVHPTGNEKMSDMYGQMFWNLVVNIVTAYVLSAFYIFATTSPYMNPGVGSGIIVAIWAWFGFQVTITSIEVLWMKRSVKLWLYEAFSALIVFIAMGAIIAGV